MIRLLQKAILVTAGGLLIASAAIAGVPSPGSSSVPPSFAMVGSLAGTPDPFGRFTVTVRDLANNPMSGASVVVDFSNCVDLKICCDQADSACITCCIKHTLRKLAGLNGSVSFIVLGGSTGSGNAVSLLGCPKIYANGVLLGSPTASAFDLDGANGVGINDLSVWLTDFGTAGNPTFGRSDFDGSGSVGINDLSVWLTMFGNGASAASCTTVSPTPEGLSSGDGPFVPTPVSCP